MGVVRTAVILGGEEVNDVGSSMKLGAWTCVHHWGGLYRRCGTYEGRAGEVS